MCRIAGRLGGAPVRVRGAAGEIPALPGRVPNGRPWSGGPDSARRAV